MNKKTIISLVITAVASIVVPLIIHFTSSNSSSDNIEINQTIQGGTGNQPISKTIIIQR